MDTQTEYKGDIKDFPKEVVAKMLDYQVKQGNKEDVTVFEQYRLNPDTHKGFAWEDTKEGHVFWDKVLVNRDFDLFFEKYPKQFNPKRGDKVLVWDNNNEFEEELIFLCEIEGALYPYIVVDGVWEKEFLEGEAFNHVEYKHMKPIPKEEPQITEVTLEEVAKMMNKDVNEIRIKK